MKKIGIKQIVLVALLCVWSTISMANTTLYFNNFNGTGVAQNAIPSNATGLIQTSLLPFPVTQPANCTITLGSSGIGSDCITNSAPGAGFPGNILAYLQSIFIGLADPNNPSNVGVFSTQCNPLTNSNCDPVLTVEYKISYSHDVTSPASVAQASYYQTDVNDYRLGWGFMALTSPNSPVTLCLGITSNKIVAFVDGLSQTSSSDTTDGFTFVSLKEIANYSPGQIVDVKIQIDQAKHTGSYIVNGVKVLTIDLTGPLPAPGFTVVGATPPHSGTRINASTSGLDSWKLQWVPLDSSLYTGSLGSASGRYTAGGLVDLQFYQTLSGLPQVIPSSFLFPFNSWINSGSYTFNTKSKMTLHKVKVYTRSSSSVDDGSTETSW